MARLKHTVSKVIRNAAARAAGMESIDPPLDFGHTLTLAVYQAAILDARAKQATYNMLLSQVDEAKLVFEAAEARVGELSARMLASVFAKFGRDSNEYEKAGGTRKPARRPRKHPPAAEPVPDSQLPQSKAEDATVGRPLAGALRSASELAAYVEPHDSNSYRSVDASELIRSRERQRVDEPPLASARSYEPSQSIKAAGELVSVTETYTQPSPRAKHPVDGLGEGTAHDIAWKVGDPRCHPLTEFG